MMTAAATHINTTTQKASSLETLDIIVLAGGPGAEREVSLQSGRAVYEAVRRLGHRATLDDISPDDLSALNRAADFVFIALHGEFGEDGTIQQILEERGLPYGGTGPAASRLAMNKVRAKQAFQQAGLPTPPYGLLTRENIGGIAGRFFPPAVLKPVASGSSVDTLIARMPAELESEATRLVNKHGELLVERYIRGPELTVAILGDQVLPPCEIRTRREFYDYNAKYLDDDTQYLFELDMPADLLDEVKKTALAAHRALGCRVFSRVDFMIDGETSLPYLLEINTIPGFTSHSLVPKAAARIGIDFDQLCQRIIELSLHRNEPNR